ncbi:MAG: KH domain-containing protein, partial [Actinomycetota bacterium]
VLVALLLLPVAVAAFAFTWSREQPAPAPVEAVIYVESKSQQGIVIGAGGAMVKAIGSSARPAIERVLGAKAMLDLRVRTQKGWRDDPALLDRLGP